jgi:hypothetical protein
MICLRFVPDASGLYSASCGLFSPYALFLHSKNLLAGYLFGGSGFIFAGFVFF